MSKKQTEFLLKKWKTNDWSAKNLKKIHHTDELYLSPRYSKVTLVSGYPFLAAVN